MFAYENEFWRKKIVIIGADEVGYGALLGFITARYISGKLLKALLLFLHPADDDNGYENAYDQRKNEFKR